MAFMTWREPNRAAWIGVRPGHNGTQIVRLGSATNTIVVMYTVTAGKTLKLLEAFLRTDGTTAGYVYISDASDVIWRHLCSVRENAPAFVASDHWNASIVPLEVPAGYKIKVQSIGAAAAVASFYGWEDD